MMMCNANFIRSVRQLCYKEWLALWYDKTLVFFILFAFSFMIYQQSQATSVELLHAAVGIVDEDKSALSLRFKDALLPPYFGTVKELRSSDVDAAMESATYTFVIHIPAHMEADIHAGKKVSVQLLIDASAIGQARIGAGYIETIMQYETMHYFMPANHTVSPVQLMVRYAYNQAQEHEWFSSIGALIQNITMLAILLTGAALLRERENGTIEHLLVMPVTPLQIILSKVIANGSVILAVSLFSIEVVARKMIGVDFHGSVALFMGVSGLYLFFSTGLGIFLGTIARSMPQMGLLSILVILPMILLSGSLTPLESMPDMLQHVMIYVPSTAFVSMAQAILFRDAGVNEIWSDMLLVTIEGGLLFAFSIMRFRNFLERQA